MRSDNLGSSQLLVSRKDTQSRVNLARNTNVSLDMRAFCYSIRDKNYRQMRAHALYGI